jgi:hypothetical protein
MTNPNKLADALRKAFDLGQRYWMLADSESYSDNRKSADVLARFDTLKREALAEHDAQPASGEWVMVPASALRWLYGEEGDFECPPSGYFRGKPAPYWWRSEFRRRIESPQPAPAPVQVDVLGELADEIEAAYPNADASNLRAFADAHPPAPAADGAGELLSMIDDVAADLTDHKSLAYEKLRKVRAAIAALRQPVPDAVRELPIELADVAHELADGSGSWMPCSGCYETSDGYNVAGFPYSDVFRCNLGGGCRECGGIGAVWGEAASASLESALASQQGSRNAD